MKQQITHNRTMRVKMVTDSRPFLVPDTTSLKLMNPLCVHRNQRGATSWPHIAITLPDERALALGVMYASAALCLPSAVIHLGEQAKPSSQWPKAGLC